MTEFNRHTFPPNGWTFRQPQTAWTNPMAMVGFKASVDAIRKHREANPAITAKHKLATDPVAIGNELENYTRQRLGIPLESPSFFQSSHNNYSPSRSGVVAVATNLKRAAQGTAVVLDWLGAGGNPVSQELAEKRASICVNCPKHEIGSWYTVAPAELIKEAVIAWQTLKGTKFEFHTSHGDTLKSCSVCRCLMRLKVFVDEKHILAKTSPDVLNELDPRCWILAEKKGA